LFACANDLLAAAFDGGSLRRLLFDEILNNQAQAPQHGRGHDREPDWCHPTPINRVVVEE
jgi:hypothetical protein